MTPPALILASTSPRRKALLALLQIPFDVKDPGYDEQVAEIDTLTGGVPGGEQARRFAEGKAAACAARHPQALVLGCDTLIELNGRVMGKPRSQQEARSMLRDLRGRGHVVHSAVALRRDEVGLQACVVESIWVHMRAVSDEELERYLAGGEWVGKAGAYAIQGRGGALIERIDGDYPAVVGLPVRRVAELLRPHLPIEADVEALYRAPIDPNWRRFSGG